MSRLVRMAIVTVALVGLAFGAIPLADAHTSPAQSCRASALRVDLGELELEPWVANPSGGPPCPTDSASLLGPTTVGPVTASVLSARTGTGGNDADAAVARVTIVLGDETVVLEGLTSTANSSCRPDGTVATHSESSVARLAVGDNTLLDVDQPLTIDLSPLVTVELNKETRTSNSVTRQAAVITTPLGEIVVAESIADSHCELAG